MDHDDHDDDDDDDDKMMYMMMLMMMVTLLMMMMMVIMTMMMLMPIMIMMLMMMMLLIKPYDVSSPVRAKRGDNFFPLPPRASPRSQNILDYLREPPRDVVPGLATTRLRQVILTKTAR